MPLESEQATSESDWRLTVPPPLTACGPAPIAVQSLQSIANPQDYPAALAGYIDAALSDNTRRAYRSDLDDFLRWHAGSLPSSPETVAAYIADRAQTLSPHTIGRRLVAIGRAHTSQGFVDPTKTDLVRTVMRGIRRTHGTPQRQASPLTKRDLLTILPAPTDLRSKRDRALVLLGFASALRRSELIALDVDDINFVERGLVVSLRRSKTDQTGKCRKIGVPYGHTSVCPVSAFKDWLQHAAITEGPVFRSIGKGGTRLHGRLTAQSVSLVLRRLAKTATLALPALSAHSLRAGLVTSAAQAGIPAYKIQEQTGHRSLDMLHRYIRDANLFDNNAAGIL